MKDSYLRSAFKLFDQDNSGKIDRDEILKLLAGDSFQGVYTKDALDKAISEVDENGDGEIDFEEFLSMMKSIM